MNVLAIANQGRWDAYPGWFGLPQGKQVMANSNYYKRLPRKRMGAGVLFFDRAGNLLIVKPRYKAGWTIPGGVVEAGESPL